MPEVKLSEATLEIEDSGGVECENCKEVKDEAVSLNVKHGAVEIMFLICADCLSTAVTSAVEDGENTVFKTSTDD